MAEKYCLLTGEVEGRNIDSVKKVVNHRGGPGASLFSESIRPVGDGNYRLQILARNNYLDDLAKGLADYALEVRPEMPVGVSGSNANYESNLM